MPQKHLHINLWNRFKYKLITYVPKAITHSDKEPKFENQLKNVYGITLSTTVFNSANWLYKFDNCQAYALHRKSRMDLCTHASHILPMGE